MVLTSTRRTVAELPAPDAVSFLTADKAPPLPAKCNVATQTSELPLSTAASAAQLLETALELPPTPARYIRARCIEKTWSETMILHVASPDVHHHPTPAMMMLSRWSILQVSPDSHTALEICRAIRNLSSF